MSEPKPTNTPATHPFQVAGYKSQSNESVALANEGKVLEERYLRWLDKLSSIEAIDKRYLALARTNVEQGAMWAIRSIFRPYRAVLPED